MCKVGNDYVQAGISVLSDYSVHAKCCESPCIFIRVAGALKWIQREMSKTPVGTQSENVGCCSGLTCFKGQKYSSGTSSNMKYYVWNLLSFAVTLMLVL